MTRRRVAVLLLTRNGARFLDEVLASVHAQDTRHDVRVLAVDSSSTDGSRRILRRHGTVAIRIATADFGHGRTRNLAASLAPPDTDYLVYLTQDATPQPGWLDALVAALDEDPTLAGAFSRQVPRPGCNPLLARRMREDWPQVGGAERWVKRLGPGGGADHSLAHFANTSSCIRRSVWLDHPLPEVDFAEDVAWARRVLLAGYGLVYEPKSAVWHSHSGSLWRQFRENVDHARGVTRALRPSGDGDAAFMAATHGPAERLRRDARWIWRAGDAAPGTRLYWTLYAPAWYAASLGGQWVGRRVDGWPPWLQSRLSWQAAVADGRGA